MGGRFLGHHDRELKPEPGSASQDSASIRVVEISLNIRVITLVECLSPKIDWLLFPECNP